MIKNDQIVRLNEIAEKIRANDENLKIVMLYEISGYRFTASINKKIICDCFSIRNLINKLEAHLNNKELKFKVGEKAWCIDESNKNVRSFTIGAVYGYNTISYQEASYESIYHLETEIFKTKEEAIESQIEHWEKMLI